MPHDLIQKLASKTAVIGVVGLGYVGLPLAIRFAEVGYKVVGLDIDPKKARYIARGRTYIEHIPDTDIRGAVGRGFEATTDFSRASEVDALILCVPTPLDSHRAPDLSFVLDTVESLLPHMHAGQVMSLESATYCGTTEEDIRPRIENTGLVVGRDIFLVYSPEREDPGNPSFTTRTIPKICGGSTPACLEAGLALYDQVIDQVVPVSSTQVAELTKLLENIHRAVNIGLVNEMKLVADKMGIAYKKNVDDMRESPSVEIMSQLQQQGANLDYSDPHVPVFPNMRRYRFDLKSIELTAEILAGYDCVVLGTDHDVFDYELIGRHAKLIVDTRGRYRKGAEKIIKA